MSKWSTLAAQRIRRVLGYIKAGRLDYLRYALWVRWKRLDFSPASREELHLDGSVEPHAASGGVFFADVLRRLEIPKGSRVVDIGCGKGSALCTLARFPFDEVVGIELTESMARIAEQNVEKLALTNVRVIVCDATEFRDLDQFTHLYMFHPFSAPLMEKLMTNLGESLQRAPRRFTVIYLFPVCDDVVRGSRLFDDPAVIDVNFTHPYYVYEHRHVEEPPSQRAAGRPSKSQR